MGNTDTKQYELHHTSTRHNKLYNANTRLKYMDNTGRGQLMVKYSPTIAKKICNRIAAGESVIEITKDKTMPSEVSFYAWLGKYPELLKDYMCARATQQHGAFDRMNKIAQDMEIPSDHKRIMIDVEKFRIVKLAPKWYGDKIIHAGDEDNPLKVESVTRTIIDPKK